MPKETIYSNPVTAESRIDIVWGRDTEVSLGTLSRDGHQEGFWVALERHAINALIRTLRKARDQAYGTDE